MNTASHDPDMPHLTAADLERVTTPEQADRLPLRCNEEDCHVATHEFDSSYVFGDGPACVA